MEKTGLSPYPLHKNTMIVREEYHRFMSVIAARKQGDHPGEESVMHYILLGLLTVFIIGILCLVILSIFLGSPKPYYMWRKASTIGLKDIAQQNLTRFLAQK